MQPQINMFGNFEVGARVRVSTDFNPHSHLAVLNRHTGTVEGETQKRPGYYDVRIDGSPADLGRAPLVSIPWHMLDLVCPIHPNAAGRVQGCIGCK